MRFDPISQAGYDGIHKWLLRTKSGLKDPSKPVPDIGLLLRGLPQGSINVTGDLGIELTQTDVIRKPRSLDAAGVAVVRLLLFGGGSLRFNSKQVGTDDQMDYLVLSGHTAERNESSAYYLNAQQEHRINYRDVDLDKVPLRRIIADTPPRMETYSHDHRSYRRGDLYTIGDEGLHSEVALPPRGSPRTSRADAIEIAIRHLLIGPKRSEVRMSAQGLGTLLKGAFGLLDLIRLGTPPNSK